MNEQNWTGDGLPSVGTVCEWFSEDYGWLVGRVVGHDDGLSVISHSDGYTGCHPEQVRPLRTPEQIAEEERKAAGLELGELYVKGGLIAIYDAGWRPRAKS